ncbi:hypothetical protein D3C78_1579790 [compost metagenome]
MLQEALADTPADALAAAGDQHHLAAEIQWIAHEILLSIRGFSLGLTRLCAHVRRDYAWLLFCRSQLAGDPEFQSHQCVAFEYG